MDASRRRLDSTHLWRCLVLFVLAGVVPRPVMAQGLTGALIGTVKDQQGAVLTGALVRVTSPSLIGGDALTTNEKGQLRFPALPPGLYVLDVSLQGFSDRVKTVSA